MRQSASVLATVKDASRRSAMAYGHPWRSLRALAKRRAQVGTRGWSLASRTRGWCRRDMPHQMGLPAPAQTSESTSDVEEAHIPTGAVFRAHPYSNPDDMLESVKVNWGRAGVPPEATVPTKSNAWPRSCCLSAQPETGVWGCGLRIF